MRGRKKVKNSVGVVDLLHTQAINVDKYVPESIEGSFKETAILNSSAFFPEGSHEG